MYFDRRRKKTMEYVFRKVSTFTLQHVVCGKNNGKKANKKQKISKSDNK